MILATSHGEIAVHRNWLDHPLFCAARYNQENGNWAFYRMVDEDKNQLASAVSEGRVTL